MKLTGVDTAAQTGTHRGKIGQAGSEEHVRPGFFECLKALDRVVQARAGVEVMCTQSP